MIPFSDTTAVLITKATVYPPEVLAHVASFPFAQIIIRTACPGIYIRYVANPGTSYEYVQDDDAICPIQELMEDADRETVTSAMKPHYLDTYKDMRFCLVGWGCVFHVLKVNCLRKYYDRYGPNDELYYREADRIFTYLNYPQKRLALPIQDMPWATAPDRLSMQPDHYKYRDEVLKRLEAM